MKIRLEIPLRASLALLQLATVLATLVIVGSGILAVALSRIQAQNQGLVAQAAVDMEARVEIFLEELESRVNLTGFVAATLAPETSLETLSDILAQARGPSVQALYVIDAQGTLVAASVAGFSLAQERELSGIDLSNYPFFERAFGTGEPHWSDKHISAVSGQVTLGLALAMPRGAGVIIAELPQSTLFRTSQVAPHIGELDYWIVDSKGEVIADTNPGSGEKLNVYSLPVVLAGLQGQAPQTKMSFAGRDYQVAASRSATLGWLFVSRTPAGMENARTRESLGILLVALVGSAVIGLLLAPFWVQRVVRPLRAVAARAHQIAGGNKPDGWPRFRIAEFNRLSEDLSVMAEAISERQNALRRLNEDLEERVERRTADLNRSNQELREALETVQQAKDELVQSEKLAALGRLVAGVAHELNTPLGNGRIAITSMADKLGRFERSLADGLRRSELEGLIQSARDGIEITERNLLRASRLVSSFKQVAADRTASRRRRFQLIELIDEVLLTISPFLKKHPIQVELSIPGDLYLDSYPGELGQVVTNLIENCALHAFEGSAPGRIGISAKQHDDGQIGITLHDNGAGMPPEVAQRAFDPFFTTSLGSGGTGLGLFIAHNAVTNVLGGTIRLHSSPGEGTTFELRLPPVAPAVEPSQGGF